MNTNNENKRKYKSVALKRNKKKLRSIIPVYK